MGRRQNDLGRDQSARAEYSSRSPVRMEIDRHDRRRRKRASTELSAAPPGAACAAAFGENSVPPTPPKEQSRKADGRSEPAAAPPPTGEHGHRVPAGELGTERLPQGRRRPADADRQLPSLRKFDNTAGVAPLSRCRRSRRGRPSGWRRNGVPAEPILELGMLDKSGRSSSLPVVPDQTVALRRRRLCHTVVSLGDPLQLARLRLRACPGCRGARCARRGCRHRDFRHRRDQCARAPRSHRQADQGRRRAWHGRARRRAVEPVSARDGSRAAAARGGHQRLHRRLPCLGLPGDAARRRPTA